MLIKFWVIRIPGEYSCTKIWVTINWYTSSLEFNEPNIIHDTQGWLTMIVYGSKPHRSLTRFAGPSVVGPDPSAVCHHVWNGRTRIHLPFEFPRRKAARPWLFWKVPRVIQPARGFQRACIVKWKLEERSFWKSERYRFAWKSTLTSESYHDGKFW